MSEKNETIGPRHLNRLDAAFKSFAEACADHVTRRSLLFHLATGAAAFVGAKFLIPAASDMFFGKSLAANSLQATTCTHGNDCGPSGKKCGLHHPIDCMAYKDCVGCFDNDTNCPKGATAGGSWTACCHCVEDATQGHFFNFHDCCRHSEKDLPKDCTLQPCKDQVTATGCKNNHYPCPGVTGNNVVPWCGVNNGKPFCTWSENTNLPCNS